MKGEGTFYNVDHLLALIEERRDGHKIWDYVNDSKLKDFVVDLDSDD